MKKRNQIIVPVFGVVLWASSILMPGTAEAQTQTDSVVVKEDPNLNYKKIQKEDLPEAVTDAFNQDYSGYVVEKAYKGENGSYKLEVARDDIRYMVFYDESGQLIKVEQPKSKMD